MLHVLDELLLNRAKVVIGFSLQNRKHIAKSTLNFTICYQALVKLDIYSNIDKQLQYIDVVLSEPS